MYSVHLPGEDLLNYHIFCNERFANSLIRHIDSEILGPDREIKGIQRFFFTRYYYPYHHLRVRLRYKNDNVVSMASFNSFCRDFLISGEISDLALHSYFPEYGKYGESGYPLVEEIFELQSLWSIEQIRNGATGTQLIIDVSVMIGHLVFSCYRDSDAALAFLNSRFTALVDYMDLKPPEFKGFRKIYGITRETLTDRLSTCELNVPDGRPFISKHLKLLDSKVGKGKNSLFSNLIHMLCNRVFETDQRNNEAVVYYLLIQSFNLQKHTLGRILR